MYNNFQKFFEIVEADTSELLEIVYRIRYQVFCVEHDFLDASQYPDKKEKDNCDDHSSHVLLRFRSSGDFIGSVRLILFNPLQPEKLFPVEMYTQLDLTLCNINALPRQQIAEISRSVIVKQFDRRRGDRRGSRAEDAAQENRRSSDRRFTDNNAGRERRSSDRRSTPHLSLILMAAVLRMSVKHNIKHWISAKDPALNRLLGYNGLSFSPIGPPVNYHGIRRPYYANVEEMLNRMYKEHHDAWEVLTDCGKYSPIQSN